MNICLIFLMIWAIEVRFLDAVPMERGLFSFFLQRCRSDGTGGFLFFCYKDAVLMERGVAFMV